MYIRRVRRRNKDGDVVRYLQIAHNNWDPLRKRSVARVVHSFGREDEVGAESIRGLARSIERLLGREKETATKVSVICRPSENLTATAPSAHSTGSVDDERASILAMSRAFSDLDGWQCFQLSRLGRIRHIPSGQFLYFEGDRLEYFYIMARGRVKIFKQAPSGNDFLIDFIGPGDTSGNVALYSGKPFPVSAQAVLDSAVLEIRNDDLVSFFSSHPQAGFKVLRKMLLVTGIRFTDTMDRALGLATERAEHRIARVLSTLNLGFGDTLPVTREQIAQMAGTTTETAVRFISRLKEMGIVHPARRRVIILDRPRLKSLSGEV